MNLESKVSSFCSGDEDDGYDETLIPLDFKTAGHILDDDLYKIVVKAMPEGVNCTVLVSPLCVCLRIDATSTRVS